MSTRLLGAFCTVMASTVLGCVSVAWPAQPAPKPADPLQQVRADFERNVSLGGMLTVRPGTPEELAEVKALAQVGLAGARAAVAKDPNSAAAQYLLGSWLLYGYRVEEVTEVFEDAEGIEHEEVVRRVTQGLGEDYQEGLEALKRATVLAPGRARYLIDYGAALFDCGEGEEALAVLEGAWKAQTGMAKAERMETAILLSRISLDEWRFREARDWAYSAVGVAAENAAAVQRLRQLDAAEAAAAQEEAGAAEEEEPETLPEAAPLAPAPPGAGAEAAGEEPVEEEAPSQENPEE